MNHAADHAADTLGDGLSPLAVARPESIEQLCDVVKTRAVEGTPLFPQGGRTSLDYGGIPDAAGVALDLRGLARVVDYPAADMTITVEAGVTLASLQDVLAREGQRLLIEAPRDAEATLGGIYATNTSGPRRFGAGRPRDQIIGVSFVNAAGEVIKGGGRVVKNVAGYDLPKLLTGSMGTLGAIAQLTLKVRPVPEASALVWGTVAAIEQVAALLDALNTSATRPIAVELLNEQASRRVADGLDLPHGAWTLVVGFEDNAKSVAWQVARIKEEWAGRASALATLENAASTPLWAALTNFADAAPGDVSILANLRPSAAAAFAALLDASRWEVGAHAGSGIVRAHLAVATTLEVLAPEVETLRARAVADGGNLTLPRCPTAWKKRLGVWGAPRADWEICRRVKAALDPGRVFNPGRFVGGI